MNVGLLVTRSARRYPTHAAAVDDRRTVTYAELEETTDRLANALVARFGVETGDRVALLCGNRAEVLEVLCGVAKSGGVYVGLNFRLDWNDLSSILENAEPRLLLVEDAFRELGARVADVLGIPVVGLDDPGPEGFRAVLAQAAHTAPPRLHQITPTDDFCIVYTSGTTGRPKGVWFDHRAVIQHATVACLEYEIDHDSRYLLVLPHNSSVNITLLPCLMRGATVRFSDSRGFDGGRFVQETTEAAATHSYLVPTMLFRLLDEARGSAVRLPSVRTLGYGAAPIPPDRVREMVERFGPVFNQLYGMAEVASIGTMLRKEDHLLALEGDERILASCGQPSYALDVRVVDPSGADVAPSERGEVVFSGPYTMKGYFRDPERTAETLRDGWVHSGDVAQVDDRGYLYIVDRMKDLIIRGGYNISPSEIENHLFAHSAVLEAAVVGMPDEEWGESVVAFVALRPGQEATEQELRSWCTSAGLAAIKTPERVVVLDTLPKNAIGKISKNDLRKRP